MGKTSGKYVGYQKNTNLVAKNAPVDTGPVTRVKTDGRIGSVTPPSYLKGGLTVDNNKGQQPHQGPIGGAAASHMSPGHAGNVWAPRVAKARAQAAAAPKGGHRTPVNSRTGTLKRMKPT